MEMEITMLCIFDLDEFYDEMYRSSWELPESLTFCPVLNWEQPILRNNFNPIMYFVSGKRENCLI